MIHSQTFKLNRIKHMRDQLIKHTRSTTNRPDPLQTVLDRLSQSEPTSLVTIVELCNNNRYAAYRLVLSLLDKRIIEMVVNTDRIVRTKRYALRRNTAYFVLTPRGTEYRKNYNNVKDLVDGHEQYLSGTHLRYSMSEHIPIFIEGREDDDKGNLVALVTKDGNRITVTNAIDLLKTNYDLIVGDSQIIIRNTDDREHLVTIANNQETDNLSKLPRK